MKEKTNTLFEVDVLEQVLHDLNETVPFSIAPFLPLSGGSFLSSHSLNLTEQFILYRMADPCNQT